MRTQLTTLLFILFLSCNPFKESTLAELQGPDVNNDGVRDDIGKWIDSLEDKPEDYKKALKQYAKYLRKGFEFVNDKEKSIKNTYRVSYSRDCTSLIYFEDVLKPAYKKAGEYGYRLSNLREESERIRKERGIEKEDLDRLRVIRAELKKQDKYNYQKYKKYKVARIKLDKEEFKLVDEIHEKIFDTFEKKKIYKKIDAHFAGKSVWLARDKYKVCEFLKKEN